MRGRSRRFVVLFSADSLALAAAGCGGGGEGEEGGLAGGGTETGGGVRGGTLVFGAAADPLVLDGALVSDVDSIRVIAQLFEMLVFLKPGTTEPQPGLAESWESDDGGTTWTFNLREDVKFHDGTEFTLRPSASTSTAGTTSRARSRTQGLPTAGRSSSAGSPRRTTRTRPRRACKRAARRTTIAAAATSLRGPAEASADQLESEARFTSCLWSETVEKRSFAVGLGT